MERGNNSGEASPIESDEADDEQHQWKSLPLGNPRADWQIDGIVGESDPRRAIRRLHRVLRYGRDTIYAAKAYSLLGDSHVSLCHNRRAVWYYTKALGLIPANNIARYKRGLAYYRLGHQVEARADLEAALRSGDLDYDYLESDRENAQRHLAMLNTLPDAP